MESLRNKVAIVGVGEVAIPKSGRSILSLEAEAAKLALEDAGLTKEDVDGLLTAYVLEEPYLIPSNIFAEYFGLSPKYNNTLNVGGATACAMVAHAASAIAAGLCETVLIAAGSNRASGIGRDRTIGMLTVASHPQFENPYGPLVPGMYALAAQRHMYEYGTTSEQLAAIAVAERKHARLKPGAAMQQPLTVDDVLSSRMVSSPLRVLDCCLVTDWGGAVIVTSAERARDLRQPPVYLLGLGEGYTHEYISQAPSLTSFASKLSAERAFRMACLTPQDVDVAQLYDCFTITVLIELEDMGFCPKGEWGRFVEGGRIELGGELPLNTNGGMLSFSTGWIFHTTEAVSQLRGQAGPRQVKGAKVAIVHGNGGIFSTHCTLLLGREPV